MFFYPKDFTFVCPTETKGFADLDAQLRDRDCRILAASTDSEFVHLAWRRDHKDLRELPFPMLADINKNLTRALGILDEEGVAKRAACSTHSRPANSARATGTRARHPEGRVIRTSGRRQAGSYDEMVGASLLATGHSSPGNAT